MQPYTADFYQDQMEGSRRSADEVVPLVLGVLRPRRVIDVGCGVGVWLAAFQRLGVDDVWGIDGDHVDRRLLEIPQERFLAHDLTSAFRVDGPFDLVVSLEVGEHLPPHSARTFVRCLAGLGPVILFSAAVPYQGGTGHVNEQWPEYWERHFRDAGYVVVDCLREQVWGNPRVEWWYAQNMLFFVRESALPRYPPLQQAARSTRPTQLSVVHPRNYLRAIPWGDRLGLAVRDLLTLIPAGASFVLVDEGQWGIGEWLDGRRHIPFLEQEGQYWGAPPDDQTAIREVERLRRGGAAFVAVGWQAFWWLDHYAEFHRHLRSTFPCALENDRLVVFDLRAPA